MTADELLREARDELERLDVGASVYGLDLLARIDARLASGGWIPVSEREPELHKIVLLREYEFVVAGWRTENEYPYVSLEEDGLTTYDTDANTVEVNTWKVGRVTHWQPIPALPDYDALLTYTQRVTLVLMKAREADDNIRRAAERGLAAAQKRGDSEAIDTLQHILNLWHEAAAEKKT